MPRTKKRFDLVRTRSLEFFINKKRGVEREKVIEDLIKFINVTEEIAEKSIERAILCGEIFEKNGKLYCSIDR